MTWELRPAILKQKAGPKISNYYSLSCRWRKQHSHKQRYSPLVVFCLVLFKILLCLEHRGKFVTSEYQFGVILLGFVCEVVATSRGGKGEMPISWSLLEGVLRNWKWMKNWCVAANLRSSKQSQKVIFQSENNEMKLFFYYLTKDHTVTESSTGCWALCAFCINHYLHLFMLTVQKAFGARAHTVVR